LRKGSVIIVEAGFDRVSEDSRSRPPDEVAHCRKCHQLPRRIETVKGGKPVEETPDRALVHSDLRIDPLNVLWAFQSRDDRNMGGLRINIDTLSSSLCNDRE